MAFEVLRALGKGRGGGWVCVGGVCTSVTATLQCGGHHSRVPVPRLEVQTPIRKRDRHHREERTGDMTQGHMDRSGGGGVTWHALLCVARFFLSSRIGCVLHDRRRLRTCCCGQRKEKEGETKTKQICDWRKIN